MNVANMHESPGGEVAIGHIKGHWHDLGRAAGTRTVGLRRIQIAPEHFSTPAHDHGADEEIFFVLSGEGLLWQDGKTYRVRGHDCIVHRPRRGPHTLRGGDGGLDVLVFGDTPFAREAAAGAPDCPPPESERPRNAVALEDVPAILDGRARRLGAAAGAAATGLNHVVLPAGGHGAPAHCHSHEEEIFVVLDGSGVLELWGRGEERPEEHPLRAGDVVSRPAATGVAHALRPGPDGITYLAYGTSDPGDMCFYPQSGRVSLRGLGIALRSPEIEFLLSL